QSSDFPFDPYISIEDEDGNLFDLRNCVPTVETEQFYGAVALDEEGGLWVFKATDPAAELMTADQVRSGEYVPVRLHSQTENCIEQIGYIYDIEGVYDGEFMISKEEQPALVACPWWSEVGLFAPGFGSDEYKKESDELIEAIREGIAIEVQKELDSDAELDQLEP
ncbi:MAG: hypothetical protein ABJK83_02380, partial [Parasphingorhabdus sp.]